mmetsp:Transcript_53217/g.106842  ORF Transcript_53217/g.106842 Transcript_53217/m.106842 type:complete len:445 (-) Transcript_53217:210-1544(-)
MDTHEEGQVREDPDLLACCHRTDLLIVELSGLEPQAHRVRPRGQGTKNPVEVRELRVPNLLLVPEVHLGAQAPVPNAAMPQHRVADLVMRRGVRPHPDALGDEAEATRSRRAAGVAPIRILVPAGAEEYVAEQLVEFAIALAETLSDLHHHLLLAWQVQESGAHGQPQPHEVHHRVRRVSPDVSVDHGDAIDGRPRALSTKMRAHGRPPWPVAPTSWPVTAARLAQQGEGLVVRRREEHLGPGVWPEAARRLRLRRVLRALLEQVEGAFIEPPLQSPIDAGLAGEGHVVLREILGLPVLLLEGPLHPGPHTREVALTGRSPAGLRAPRPELATQLRQFPLQRLRRPHVVHSQRNAILEHAARTIRCAVLVLYSTVDCEARELSHQPAWANHGIHDPELATSAGIASCRATSLQLPLTATARRPAQFLTLQLVGDGLWEEIRARR